MRCMRNAIATCHECSDLCVLFLMIFIFIEALYEQFEVFMAIRWRTAFILTQHTHTRHMPFIMWMYEFHNITKIKKEKTQTTWGTNTRPHYSRTSRMYAQNETHIHCRSLLDHIFMNKNVNNFSILLARKINVDKMNWMLRHKEMILNGTWIIN